MTQPKPANEAADSDSYSKLVRVAVFVVLGTFALLVILLIVLVLVGKADNIPVLEIFGVVLVQTVALVGILITDSIDTRSHALAIEAGNRLSVEVSLAAIEKLSASEEQNERRFRNGAVLIALTELHQVPLAVALLPALWAGGEINPEPGTHVVSAGLRSDKPHVQISASATLIDHVDETFPSEGPGYYLPEALLEEWPVGLSDKAKTQIVAYYLAVVEKIAGNASLSDQDLVNQVGLLLTLFALIFESKDETHPEVLWVAHEVSGVMMRPAVAIGSHFQTSSGWITEPEYLELRQESMTRSDGTFNNPDLSDRFDALRQEMLTRFPHKDD
jgi:hypothetical protein